MNWPAYKLSDLTDRFISGGTPGTKVTKYWDGEIPWITGADFTEGEVILGRKYINEKAVENSATNVVPKGSILLVTRTGVGKLAIAPVDIAISQDITGVILKPQVNPAFLAAALKSKMPLLLSAQRGATIKGITRKDLEKLKIELPAYSEQQKIVEILGRADALRKKRAEADAIAERILPALFYRLFGDPGTNPKGWPVVPITELVDSIERRDPSLQPKEPFFYIDIAGVDGQLGAITGARKLIGSEAPGRARQIIAANDVLISTVRPYLRATALVPALYDKQICSTGFCVLRAKGSSGFGFLYTLSRLQWFTDQLTARARGASYPAVTDTDVLGLSVPHPNDGNSLESLDRQVLDYLLLKEKQRKVGTRIALLFEVLLHRAFSGDLTAKWREAHMKELLVEMEEQDRFLKTRSKEVAND